MQKVFFLVGFLVSGTCFGDLNSPLEGYSLKNYNLINEAKCGGTSEESGSKCCKRGKKGKRGATGPRGPTGATGATGATGPSAVVDVLEVGIPSSPFFPTVIPADGYFSFTSTNVDSDGGMSLVESVPSSGNFDTILLPPSVTSKYYLVTYGFSPSPEGPVSSLVELELNGSLLFYTLFQSIIPSQLLSKTVLVVNPPSVTPGTLRLQNRSLGFAGSAPLPLFTNFGETAYISITAL